MRENKNITVTEIARQLDLSRSTIDRVINERGNVAAATKEKVLKYIEKINYTPNRAARHLAKMTNYTIAISYYFPRKFAEKINQGIDEIYEELNHYGLNIIIRAAQSREEQLAQIKELAEQVDALILSAWDKPELITLINELVERGIPVATFNRDLPGSNRLFYFGCDYYQSGRLAGEIIAKMADPGKIAIIGDPEDRIAAQRITGFKDVLQKLNDFKLIGPWEITQNFNLTASLNKEVVEKVEEISLVNQDLTAVFVVNQTLKAVAEAINKLGKASQVKIIGYDLYQGTVKLIEADLVQAVICQQPFNQGYFPLKLLFEMLADQKDIQTEEYITKLEIVMKENLCCYDNYRGLS